MSNRALALVRNAATIPDKTALMFEGEAWSFASLAQGARAHAAGLAAAGLRRSDKLGLMLAARPDFILLQYGAFLLGAVVLPLNVHYLGGEIEYALASCEIDMLVIDAAFAERLQPGFRDRCPSLRRMVVLDGGSPLCGDPAAAPAPADLAADDVALMLTTSATTGKAKGVMLTVGNLEANYDRSPEWLGLKPDEVILCALPLYNTFALNQCINATIFLGATMVLLPRFDALTCLAAIERYGCTFFPSVPTMLQRMLHHPEVDRFNLRSLRRLCVGAAPVPAPLLARVHGRCAGDTVVITGYGLTEGTALVATHEVALDVNGELIRPKSVGRALPGTTIAILDESGREVPFGTVGEICIRGPNVMKGYYNMPDATAEALAGGWLHTGDLGAMDADGHFAIVDRKKDLIIRGGQNIYPADIEEALYRHPAVAEAAVIPIPDAGLGEVPKAYVALKPGRTATSEELLARCRDELAYYKVPVAIEILPDLPKGPTGKILRRELRAPVANP
jgi:long-chain acyl-CoA synthetase